MINSSTDLGEMLHGILKIYKQLEIQLVHTYIRYLLYCIYCVK